MSNTYVKNYDVGQIKLDLPKTDYIHELPLLSFGDIQHTVNLSLVFNSAIYDEEHDDSFTGLPNLFRISSGYKLNLQKLLTIYDGYPVYLQEGSGKVVFINQQSDNIYTFEDDSQRILRVEQRTVIPVDPNPKDDVFPTPIDVNYYIVENPDYSKEEYEQGGKLVAVYDKYGSKYLEYIYNGALLQEIRYRSKKKIVFGYNSINTLNSITYKYNNSVIYSIELSFDGSNAIIKHASGMVCNIEHSNNLFKVYSRENETATNYIREISYTRSPSNTCVTVEEKINDEIVDSTTYESLDWYEYSEFDYHIIQITNHYGTKVRLQYNNDGKLRYSYEIGDEDVEFCGSENNTWYEGLYLGKVGIYGFENDDSDINLLQNHKYDNRMNHYTRNENKFWSFSGLPVYNSPGNGYCIVTGWLRFSDSIQISDLQYNFTVINSTTTFSVIARRKNQWQFFACKIPCERESLEISAPCYDEIETKDFRLTHFPAQIKLENPERMVSISEDDVLLSTSLSGSPHIPIKDCTFKYYFDDNNYEELSGDLVCFDDILKYKINQAKQVNTDEFYYNKVKNIITGVTNVTFTYDGNTYTLVDHNLAKVSNTLENTITTRYKMGWLGFLSIEKSDKNNNIFQSITLDENLDIESESNNNTNIQYYRESNGLVYKQIISPKNNYEDNYEFVKEFEYNEDSSVASNNFTKLIRTIDEFGNKTEYTTDETWGIVTGVTFKDSNNVVQSVIADTFDDDKCALLSRQFADVNDPRVTQFGYSQGNLASVIHGDTEESISFAFDYDNGNLKKVEKGTTTIEEHEHTNTTLDSYYPTKEGSIYSVLADFDKYGRLTKIDNLVSYTYDSVPEYSEDGTFKPHGANSTALLAISQDLTNNQTSKYHYNEKRKVNKICVENSAGTALSEETFEYDKINRLTKDVCTYDKASNKKIEATIAYTKSESDVTADNMISTYTYASPAVTSITNNEYDPHQRLSNKVHTIGSKTFSKTLGYTLTRPTSLTDKCGNTVIGTTSYGYDAMGRISSIDNGEAVTYEYDEYGQLIRENNKILDKTIQYVYNVIGNIESINTYAYTPAGTELSGTPVTTAFVYSNTTHPDRLTKVGSNYISYNSIGCMTAYQSRNFRWDKGKLAGFTRGSMSQPGSVYEDCTYTYNGYGQRVSKTYTYDPNPAVSKDGSYTYTTTYKYDHSGRLINEYTVQTHEIGGQSSREITYLYDESGVIGCVFTANGASVTYYYQRNLLGDVVAIYDTNGNKKVEYAYDAFGNCTTIYGTTSTMGKYNPFRYRGYYFDTETNWYFLNARYYAPELRRFISPDDTAYLDPESVNGLNLYCYCNNDPVNYCDPSGHSIIATLLISLGVIGVIGGLGYAAYTDYQDNYNIDGSIGLDYLWLGIIGGAIGAGIGLGIGLFGPALATYLGGALSSFGAPTAFALAGGGTSSVAVIGTLEAMLAAGALILFASNNRPKNNQVQNKQFEDAVRKAGYDPKNPMVRDELQKMHRYIRSKKLNLGWKELVELIKEWLG